ncbi:hypothetical protein BDK51DRAFT_46202 [Blyttiomyces helicus]|uniref:Uncharacterized protein n=1 Tax=Blyttiomyces helicus TaxID=388810 RepID=A0A4P9W0Q3_9FUNG|nr:hypothetical protein BDK51DRAFT_46202 [Blyttiomyces helicus]|eukprot:RKO85731.1 hypothetical protein BDK51DRAFT_46202 [Blyttiomyces helicus]
MTRRGRNPAFVLGAFCAHHGWITWFGSPLPGLGPTYDEVATDKPPKHLPRLPSRQEKVFLIAGRGSVSLRPRPLPSINLTMFMWLVTSNSQPYLFMSGSSRKDLKRQEPRSLWRLSESSMVDCALGIALHAGRAAGSSFKNNQPHRLRVGTPPLLRGFCIHDVLGRRFPIMGLLRNCQDTLPNIKGSLRPPGYVHDQGLRLDPLPHLGILYGFAFFPPG